MATATSKRMITGLVTSQPPVATNFQAHKLVRHRCRTAHHITDDFVPLASARVILSGVASRPRARRSTPKKHGNRRHSGQKWRASETTQCRTGFRYSAQNALCRARPDLVRFLPKPSSVGSNSSASGQCRCVGAGGQNLASFEIRNGLAPGDAPEYQRAQNRNRIGRSSPELPGDFTGGIKTVERTICAAHLILLFGGKSAND